MKQVRFECRDELSNRLLFTSPDWYSIRASIDWQSQRGQILDAVVIVDRELLCDPKDNGVVWRSHPAA